MRNRKDFYKYNLILAVIVFLTIFMHLDNSTQTKSLVSQKPNFAPQRYLASLSSSQQKTRQVIGLSLIPEKLQSSYRIRGYIEASDLENTTLQYKWVLGEGQQLVSGDLHGTFTLSHQKELSIEVDSSAEKAQHRVRLEVFTELNGIKIGNVRSVELSTAPTEKEVQLYTESVMHSKAANASKTKNEILEEISKTEPLIKIRQ